MNPPSGSLIRLLVGDQCPLFVRGVRAVVDETSDFEWVGASADSRKISALAENSLTSILLIDLELATSLGFSLLSNLRSGGRSVRTIVLSGSAQEEMIFRAVTDGVHGFLLKSVPLVELVDAIRLVHQGQQVIDPTATDALVRKIRTDADQTPVRRLASLSPQENRVLACVAEGKTNKEIGRDLKLSEKTVKNYLSKVLDKLDMRRRSQAAAFYARHLS